MHIFLVPRFGPGDSPRPIVDGDKITIGSLIYDFSPLPDGAEIEVGLPFMGPVIRINGVIHCVIDYEHCWDTSEDWQSESPADYIFNITSGQCPCPIKRKTLPLEAADA